MLRLRAVTIAEVCVLYISVEINLCLFGKNKTRTKNHQHLNEIKQLWWYPWLYVQNKTKIKCFVEYRNIAQLYKKT